MDCAVLSFSGIAEWPGTSTGKVETGVEGVCVCEVVALKGDYFFIIYNSH